MQMRTLKFIWTWLIILVFISGLLFAGIVFYPKRTTVVPVKPVVAHVVTVQKHIPKGTWVTVFSGKKVLYSKTAIRDLLNFCKKHGIEEIYLQIYRSGEAYYDSRFVGRSQYQKMLKAVGSDPIDYLLDEAKKNQIRVYAWVNILSLAQNKNAPIVRKYGYKVFTRDQSGRDSVRTDSVDLTDKFYLRDDQIFLEPGDERVVDWSLAVVKEIAERYPAFDGIHLDYIRYPYPVPYIPDSRFVKFGIAYGYGKRNLERFKAKTGLNPLKDDVYDNDLYLLWDNWKRAQVTNIVEKISALLHVKAKGWKISCAVVPTLERAYSIAYQNWPLWLQKSYVDYVVLMNYSRDETLVKDSIMADRAFRKNGKIYAGLGAFLYNDGAKFNRLINAVIKLNPDGVVLFSYDELDKLGGCL